MSLLEVKVEVARIPPSGFQCSTRSVNSGLFISSFYLFTCFSNIFVNLLGLAAENARPLICCFINFMNKLVEKEYLYAKNGAFLQTNFVNRFARYNVGIF